MNINTQNPVILALKEHRLEFYNNGSYSYIPSRRYKETFTKKTSIVGQFKKPYWEAIDMLDKFLISKNIASVKNKKVKDVFKYSLRSKVVSC